MADDNSFYGLLAIIGFLGFLAYLAWKHNSLTGAVSTFTRAELERHGIIFKEQ